MAALRCEVKDEVTFRGRAGWATGDFLPYMFGGLAVGRMDVSSTVSSSVNRTVFDAGGGSTSFALPQFALTSTVGKSNAFVAGWTAGLGLEYMVCGNVFLRGEWEYIQFVHDPKHRGFREQRARGPRLQVLIAAFLGAILTRRETAAPMRFPFRERRV